MSGIQIHKTKKDVTQDIRDFCTKHRIRNYSINKDLSINVYQNIRLVSLYNLPIRFNECYGDFTISIGNLTSLENTPRLINGDFSYSSAGSKRKLESLKGHPDYVCGSFTIHSTNVSKVDTLPVIIGNLNLSDNKIETIEYVGQICLNSNPLFELKTNNNSDDPTLTQFTGTPIYKLCLEVNVEYWRFYDKWLNNQVILERINEFSIIDYKSIDYIRLNDLYDFLEIPFYPEIVGPKIEKLGYSFT